MKITKCDRCDKEIKEGSSDKKAENFEFRHLNNHEFWELCQDCYTALKLFFREAWK